VSIHLTLLLANIPTVYYDPGFVPVHVGQRLIGIKTHTPNHTIYLFDHDGEKVGWVSADTLAKFGKESSDSQVYCFIVCHVSPKLVGPKKGTLQGDLYTIDGLRDADAYRGNDFPDAMVPFDEGSMIHRFITKTANGQPSTSKGTSMISKTPTSNAIVARASAIVTDNADAMKTAAYLEAGTILNTQLGKIASAKLPLMLRGYANTPVGALVIANLFNVAITQFRPDDKLLGRLAQASLEAAHLDAIRALDINGLIDELLSVEAVKRALGKVSEGGVA
jgi:hypothetical protein